MKARKSTVVAVCFVLLGTATSAQAAAHLYASTVWGTLYDLNPATGQATNPRDTGTVHLVDIEVDSDGTMYGLTSWGGQPPNSLVRINPAAGDATLVGATGLNSIYEGDLALDPATGQLYGASDYSGGDLRLFRIDKNSGAATVVGAIPYFGDFSGLAFDRDGNLFTIDTDSRLLFKLDKNNAGILVQVPLTGFHGSITAGMAADPTSGIMYVASGDVPTSWLYSLATDTGVLTTVANTNVSGWAGLTFAPPPPAAIGDMNCDGVVDFDDIDPFMLALMDHDAYVAAYPGCDYYNGDCSGNGYVDFGDINCFVALLSGSNRVDLGDVAVGGNGNGSAAPGLGVSVQTANFVAPGVFGGYGTGGPQFKRTDGTGGTANLPFVEGIFWPRGTTPITSQGTTYAFPNTGGRRWDAIRNALGLVDQDNHPWSIRLDDQPGVDRRGIGMHANSGITFDLDKLRLAGESFDAVSGVAGLNWTYFGDPVADIEVWVLVDGVLKYHQFFKQNVRMYEAFTVSLPPDSHYLSLAATDYNGIPQDDHAVFADVALVRNP